MSAIEIQRIYQEAAEKAYRGRDKMTDDILGRWKYVLDALERNPMELDREIDWVIKKKLIDSYMIKNSCGLDDKRVREIDLRYHDIDRKSGLFYKLQRGGFVERLVTDEQIEHAVNNPPGDTRARIRGMFVSSRLMGKQMGREGWYTFSFLLSKGKISKKCVECSRKNECAQYEYKGITVKLNNPLDRYEDIERLIKSNEIKNE